MAYGKVTKTTQNQATGDNNIDALLTSRRWASNNVTFSFTNNFKNDYEDERGYPKKYEAGFQSLDSTDSRKGQKKATVDWMEMYENVSGLKLTELKGRDDRNATIRIAISDEPSTAEVAAFPGDRSFTGSGFAAGDIWFNPDDYNTPTIGNFAFHTFGHEIGHALGLRHGHSKGGVKNVAATSDRDSMEFSIMTYRSYEGASTGSYSNETWGYAQSLMLYDIRAIQEMYGANFDYNSGGTDYTFSATTGEMFVNGQGQGTPGGNRIFRTIWDGNGIDTYNFSNYTTDLNIDLRPGKWSDLDVGGDSQRAVLQRSDLGDKKTARGHVFNALQFKGDKRSLIENANGGSGDDRIQGNIANNKLRGYSGDDTLIGGAGNDTLIAGIGDDTVIVNNFNGNERLYGGTGDDLLILDPSDGRDLKIWMNRNEVGDGKRGSQHFYDFEIIQSGQGDDYIEGDRRNNILLGGEGDDTITGGAGDDSLFGEKGDDTIIVNDFNGNDRLYGSGGLDTLVLDPTDGRNLKIWMHRNEVGDGKWGSQHFYDFEVVRSGRGNDLIEGDRWDNFLFAGSGNDTLMGGAGDDYAFGESGDDTLIIRDFSGNDYFYGGSGQDTLVLDPSDGRNLKIWLDRNEVGDGRVGAQVFYNFETVKAGRGDDLLEGDDNANTLYGGAGEDFIQGKDGNDALYGEDERDLLYGGKGSDTLVGGGGNDFLSGYGEGSLEYDTLTGGDGGDTFSLGYNWTSGKVTIGYLGGGLATILDFSAQEGDRIRLGGSVTDYTFKTHISGYGNRSVTDTLITRGSDIIAIAYDATISTANVFV